MAVKFESGLDLEIKNQNVARGAEWIGAKRECMRANENARRKYRQEKFFYLTLLNLSFPFLSY
jgi:hypothetical protein